MLFRSAAAIGLVSAEQNFNPFAVDRPFICGDPTLPKTEILRGITPLVDPAVDGSAAANALSARSKTTPLNAAGKSVAQVMADNGFATLVAKDLAGNVVENRAGAGAGGGGDVEAEVPAGEAPVGEAPTETDIEEEITQTVVPGKSCLTFAATKHPLTNYSRFFDCSSLRRCHQFHNCHSRCRRFFCTSRDRSSSNSSR